jgi:LPS O-antigen subunit length determinant protein (WzzB/FepE family)
MTKKQLRERQFMRKAIIRVPPGRVSFQVMWYIIGILVGFGIVFLVAILR